MADVRAERRLGARSRVGVFNARLRPVVTALGLQAQGILLVWGSAVRLAVCSLPLMFTICAGV